MAETVQINAEFNSKGAVKGLVDVEKATKKASNTISGLESKAEALRNKLKGVSVGSEEFKKLQKELVKTDSALKNANKSIEGLDTEGKAGELGKIAGGLGAIGTAGALAFGNNEDAEAFFQTFAQGLAITNAAKGGIEAFTAVQKLVRVGYIQETAATVANTGAKIINTTVTAAKNVASGASIALTAGVTGALGAQTVATGAASVATGVLGAAMAIALAPITLIIAAITAVVAAFAYFTSSSEDSTQASKDLSKSIEKQNELREKQAALAERVAEQELKIAKIQGKNADEILEAEKKVLKTKEENRKKDIKQNIDQHAKLKKMRKKLLAQGNDERASELAQEMDAIKKKNKELKSQEGQYYDDIKVLDEQRKADLEQLADDLSDAELSELDKRLDDNKEYYDALILEAGENEDLVAKIKEQRTKKEDEIRQEDRRKRAKEYKQILRDREEAERDLRDVNIELIADDAERERAEFVASQEDRLAEIEKTYGKESELAQKFRDKQAADLKAYDEQARAEADAKVKAEADAKAKEVREAFEQQQRIDEAKIAAKEAGLDEDDFEGLVSLEEDKFNKDLKNLQFQLEQRNITRAEFDAKEEQRKAEHQANLTAIEQSESDKRKEAATIEADHKAAMQEAVISSISNAINIIKTLGGESKALQATAIIGENAVGIAKQVIATQAANAAVTAKYALIPGGAVPAAAEITANKINLALGIASSVAATGMALSKLKAGGGAGVPSSPTGGGNLGGGGGSFTPSLPNLSGQTLQPTGGQGNQEAGTNQQAPIVIQNTILESDITTAQNNVASIEDAATFN